MSRAVYSMYFNRNIYEFLANIVSEEGFLWPK